MGRGDERRSFDSTQVFPDAVVMSLGVDAELAKALDRERSAERRRRRFNHGYETPEEKNIRIETVQLFKDVFFGLVRFLGLHETGRFFVEMNTECFVRGERGESKASILGCDRVEIRRSMSRSRHPQEELDVLKRDKKNIQFTGGRP